MDQQLSDLLCARRMAIRLLITIAISLLLTSPVSGSPLSPGLQTHIWHDMWQTPLASGKNINPENRMRWGVAAANLGKYRELGAQWNLVAVYQELNSDQEIRRLHRVVDEHRKNGINVIFRVYEDPDIYADLAGDEDPAYGYNKGYFEWVSRLAREFAQDVKTYLISNEIDNDLRFNTIDRRKPPHEYFVDYEDYRKVLDTAFRAVKSINPTLTVVNHGFGSTALGFAVADEMIRSGNPRKAHEFWKTLQDNQGLYAESFPHFLKRMASPAIRRKINIVRDSLTEPGDCDAIQLHYYHSWKVLPQVITWIQGTMQAAGTTRPILATEVGYLMPWKMGVDSDGKIIKVADMSRFSEQDHAESLVKLYAILAGSGISKIQYWQMRFHHDRSIVTRLYHAPERPEDFSPLKAAGAYQVMTHQIGGLIPTKGKLDVPGISEFRFTGDRNISVIWSDVGGSLPTEILDRAGQIYDIYGSPIIQKPGSALALTGTPMYVEWKALSHTTP